MKTHASSSRSRIIILFWILAFSAVMLGAKAQAQTLLAYYTFDNGADLGQDTSGNGYNLTPFSNGGTLSPTQNTSSFVQGTASANFGLTTAAEGFRTTSALAQLSPSFTLSVWVNTNLSSYSTNQALISSRISTTSGVYMFLNSSNVFEFATYNGSAAVYNSGTTISQGVWTNLIITYDGTAIRGYVNGVQVGSSVVASYVAPGTGASILLGRRDTGTDTEYLDGQMDAVSIFSGALTSSQVLNLYTNGVSAIPEPSQASLFFSVLAIAAVGLWRKRLKR